MASGNYKKRYQLVKAQVDQEMGRSLGLWGKTKGFFGGGNTFTTRRKAMIDKHYEAYVHQSFINQRHGELRAMHAKSGATPQGRAQAARELSTGAKNVMEYASGLHAVARKKGIDDLSDLTFDNLRVGSEAMHRVRQKLNKGRGNVDANDPRFPEAHYRTAVGYQNFIGGDFAQNASVAELMRAGNCDMHAASTYTDTAAHMDPRAVAAKVGHGGAKHTFSELRGPMGHTETDKRDVIVDSWATEKHAVLRGDSEFGADISASRDHSTHENLTEQTINLDHGRQEYHRSQHIVNTHQGFQAFHDVEAAKPENRPTGPVHQYGATPMMSAGGQARLPKRAAVLKSGGSLLSSLQRVEVARKMGASIAGAAKYANSKKNS
ncbi:MAG: hypothetical protein AAF431_03775 [Pseudomonadota bacterium]